MDTSLFAPHYRSSANHFPFFLDGAYLVSREERIRLTMVPSLAWITMRLDGDIRFECESGYGYKDCYLVYSSGRLIGKARKDSSGIINSLSECTAQRGLFYTAHIASADIVIKSLSLDVAIYRRPAEDDLLKLGE